MTIARLTVRDIRFPTSQHQDGSDALNLGDYSATYVVLETGTGLEKGILHMATGAVLNAVWDACRMGGLNEALAVMLRAHRFGKPVCPHAGGVGLCEYVQHLSIFDYIAVSGSLDHRVCEYVDHLREHFIERPRLDAPC